MIMQRTELTPEVARAGGIGAVVEAMRQHAEHAGVQEQACFALRNLTYDNAQNRVEVARAGGIRAVLEAMRQHAGHAGVQQWACVALYNVACKNADNKGAMRQLGVRALAQRAYDTHKSRDALDLVNRLK